MLLLKADDEVNVGESSLLELSHVEEVFDLSKYLAFGDLLHYALHFEIEHPRNDVGSLSGALAIEEVFLYLGPVGVARDCDEQIRFSQVCHDAHGIHVKPPIKFFRVVEVDWHYISLPCIGGIGFIEDLFGLPFKFMVVHSYEVEIVVFNHDPDVAEELLEKSATP